MNAASDHTSRDVGRTVLAFLRNELAATPARWRATLRIIAAFALSVVALKALQVPNGEYVIVSLFIVSQSDAWASVTKAVLRVVGTLTGGALGLFAVIALIDKPWLLLPYQALIVAVSLFFSRTTTAPYAFLLGGITYLIAVAPPYLTSPQATIEQVLWRILLTTLGTLIGTAAQLLLWRDDPETLLLDDLAQRLRLAADLTGRTLNPTNPEATAPVPDLLAATGVARQLDLLANAEAQSRWLRQRHPEQQALISSVELMVVAALRLEQIRIARGGALSLSDSARARLQHLRDVCSAVARSLRERRVAETVASITQRPVVDATQDATLLAVLSCIVEMERALERLPSALTFLDADGLGAREGQPVTREPVAPRSLFTPDCSLHNVDIVRFSLKGALGATIADLVYNGLNWPGISTAVLTCLVVAQSNVGASLQKAILRFAGASLGGLASLITIVMLMPNMEHLSSLLVVTCFWFAGAAWIVSGSTRISYAGLQISIALALCLINSLAPTIDLAIASDRIVGVLLGIAIMGAVDILVWPVYAVDSIRGTLAHAVSEMADYLRLASRRELMPARTRSFSVFRDLTNALTLQDALRIESQFGVTADTHADRALRLANRTQHVFLSVMAAARHRYGRGFEAEPEEDARLTAVDVALADELDRTVPTIAGAAVTGRAAGGAAFSTIDLALAAADRPPADPLAQMRLRAQLILYRELIAALRELAQAADDLAEVAPPAGSWSPALATEGAATRR